MSEETIFSKIINGDIPGVFVYEDEYCVVLMDAFPSVPGQTMVIPRESINYFGDTSDETFSHLMLVAKQIAKASDKAFDTSRTCVVIEGFEVPHVHIKLYPISKESGVQALTDVITSTKEATLEEREVNATKIKNGL